MLTDWLENLLAALDDDPESNLHEDLAAGQPRWGAAVVREAFGELARVWSVPGAFPGGGRRALLTQFDASVIQVTDREAVMTCEGDFVADVAGRFPPEGDPEGLVTFGFPAVGDRQPVVVGGDAAVVLHDSPAGHELVEWLTRPESFRPWLQDGGFLSPNGQVTADDYPPGFTRSLVPEIQSPDPALRPLRPAPGRVQRAGRRGQLARAAGLLRRCDGFVPRRHRRDRQGRRPAERGGAARPG